jgi:tight adherence protein B
MHPLVYASAAALLAFGAAWGFLYGASQAADRRRLVRERLGRAKGTQAQGLELTRPKSRFPGLSLGQDVAALLKRANWSQTSSGLAGRCGLAALAGGGAGLVLGRPVLALVLAAAGAYLPLFLLRRAARKRTAALERQLPDALDLVARALRAGHAFSGALRLAADEFPEPLGPELRTVVEEVNLGLDLDAALAALASRFELADLTFFVVSVAIQRDTGGNLAEIVSTIARLVRERFKLHGKVRVLSAEGRLSAGILLALPFLVALAIFFLNRDYLGLLAENPLGRFMVALALGMMTVGVLIIRKMVAIKV